jgi:transposase
MMKLQDVLLKAMAKKMSWADAAEIIGVSCRTMRRWRERMEEGGYSGLADRRKGRPSGKPVALKTVEQVLALYRKTYHDFKDYRLKPVDSFATESRLAAEAA